MQLEVGEQVVGQSRYCRIDDQVSAEGLSIAPAPLDLAEHIIEAAAGAAQEEFYRARQFSDSSKWLEREDGPTLAGGKSNNSMSRLGFALWI